MTALTIEAHNLRAGDIVTEHDWHLHVARAWQDTLGVSVAFTEFDFLRHYSLCELVIVERA